ncbi:hypothetical protein MSAN_00447700 [Mycena sanguinolenta]|uniref:Uncharacterized protein n=1 Tax=Mycena sanguinolenta TaxID=230812 RepID=A0A8H6ZG10_9AGAR|nr:hypothetical protein MSAN_00447700 [Mycena sanguinolenta]
MPQIFVPPDVLAAAVTVIDASDPEGPLAALRAHLVAVPHVATVATPLTSTPTESIDILASQAHSSADLVVVPHASTSPGSKPVKSIKTYAGYRSYKASSHESPSQTVSLSCSTTATTAIVDAAQPVWLPWCPFADPFSTANLSFEEENEAFQHRFDGSSTLDSLSGEDLPVESSPTFRGSSPFTVTAGSSPTLQGSSPVPFAAKVAPLRLLSPLDVGIGTIVPDCLSQSLSPLSPLSPSPSSPLVGAKRKASEMEEEDKEYDDEDGEDEDDKPRHRLFIRLPYMLGAHPRRRTRGRAAGGAPGGGGGGGLGGRGPANLWTPDCPHRGNASRVGQAGDIGVMPCHDDGCEHGDCQEAGDGDDDEQEQNDSQEGGRKHRKRGETQVEWRRDQGSGRRVTKGAGYLLSQFLTVFGRKGRAALESILAGPPPAMEDNSGVDMAGVDTVALVKRLDKNKAQLRIGELEYMLSLMQLSLNIDSEQRDALAKGDKNMASISALARKYGKARETFNEWVGFGHRLLFLCAGGSLYLLPIIAALDGQWLPLVWCLMVPLHYMRNVGGYIRSLRLYYHSPVADDQPSQCQTISLADQVLLEEIYSNIETNCLKLPVQSSEWEAPTISPSWKPLDNADLLLPEAIVITTPLKLETTACPVKPKN